MKGEGGVSEGERKGKEQKEGEGEKIKKTNRERRGMGKGGRRSVESGQLISHFSDEFMLDFRGFPLPFTQEPREFIRE